MTTTPTLTNWLHLLTLGIIWGGTFMFISIALRDYGPIRWPVREPRWVQYRF